MKFVKNWRIDQRKCDETKQNKAKIIVIMGKIISLYVKNLFQTYFNYKKISHIYIKLKVKIFNFSITPLASNDELKVS